MTNSTEGTESSKTRAQSRVSSFPPLGQQFTAKEVAKLWRVSESFLAKARMRGDGPPFIKVGRSIRYSEVALQHWMRARQRLSTSEDYGKQRLCFE